ncbi:hypothetical protein LIPSTDRAFT_76726, partial [Lipomyces starkeyi NRRL Y-11557]
MIKVNIFLQVGRFIISFLFYFFHIHISNPTFIGVSVCLNDEIAIVCTIGVDNSKDGAILNAAGMQKPGASNIFALQPDARSVGLDSNVLISFSNRRGPHSMLERFNFRKQISD